MTTLGPLHRDDLNNFIVTSALPIQCGFMAGFLLGGYAAGQRASLQFLAENQHEMPRTRTQGLLYHRNKNYRMMAAFGAGGLRRGLQLASVATSFLLIKKGLEIGRQKTGSSITSQFDDLIAGSLIGSSFFLLSSRKQKLFHFKKGILLGSMLAKWSDYKYDDSGPHGFGISFTNLLPASAQSFVLMSSESLNINSSGPVSTSNINPPSSSGVFVRIESVHLLVHQNSRIYRKLLAPEPPQTSSRRKKFASQLEGELLLEDEHFINTIRLIEGCTIQYEFDFRIVTNSPGQSGNNEKHQQEINLLFHEFLQENIKTCSFYVENMGKFGVSPSRHSFRYLTTPSAEKSSSYGQASFKNMSIRLEIFDLDRTPWFIGEWKVKFQSSGIDADNWLRKGARNSRSKSSVSNSPKSDGPNSLPRTPTRKSHSPQPRKKTSFDDFDEIKSDELVIETTLKIPSNFPSRTPSPLSRTGYESQSYEESSTNSLPESHQMCSPDANSISASFEDLDLNDFTDIDQEDDSLTLPSGTNSPNYQERRLLFADEQLNLPPSYERKSSLVPSRTVTPIPLDLSTVDIIHQVGANLFSTRLGQFVASSIKSDPSEQNLKTSYSTSAIHLLGTRYQLQGLNSNVLLMEAEEGAGHEDDDDDEFITITRIDRFNNFSSLLKRIQAPTNSKLMIVREVLLLKRAGPMITSRLKLWFESFNRWTIEEFTPATLRVFFHGITIELKVFNLKPNSSSPVNTPELFLVDLQLIQALNPYSTGFNTFQCIAEANAFFVEMTAFTVQMEMSEARRPPEIVLMETWNSHTDSEQLSQSESIPIVKYSVIPLPSDNPIPFSILVYFWSDHLQGWLLQNLSIQGMILSIHPLLDARMAIQINLSGSHVKASQDEGAKIGNFTLITSRGQVYNFRTVQVTDLKEIIGRIRFATLSRGSSNTSSDSVGTAATAITSSRSKRQGSLLQADKIYRGIQSPSSNTANAIQATTPIPDEEIEKIRNQNLNIMDSFLEDFRTRFWCTYRRNFPRIEPSLFTTDLGWGCMLRTGQCLMAEALARFFFGRNWRLWQIEESQESEKIKIMRKFYMKIVSQFIDQSSGEYSVHRLAMEGAKIGTPIGQWFGPSIIGKVLKSITNNLKDSPFWVYLSSDGTFPTSHLLKIVSQRAALILLPLRLGIDTINPIYGQFIRGALRSNSSLGIVGGLPDKSLYFVGYQDWDLLFLDPHILKPFDPSAFSDSDKLIEDYHTSRVRSIPIEEIDPSMLFGFLCCSAEEVVQLRDHLIKLNRHANILSINND